MAVKDRDATPQDVAAAQDHLFRKISGLRVQVAPIFSNRHATLGIVFPRRGFGPYAVIAAALRSGTYSALHSCRYCKKFFVDRDHRAGFCHDEAADGRACQDAFETLRVKIWRAKQ